MNKALIGLAMMCSFSAHAGESCKILENELVNHTYQLELYSKDQTMKGSAVIVFGGSKADTFYDQGRKISYQLYSKESGSLQLIRKSNVVLNEVSYEPKCEYIQSWLEFLWRFKVKSINNGKIILEEITLDGTKGDTQVLKKIN